MMSPMDLFNAITPESPGHDDTGDGAAGAGNGDVNQSVQRPERKKVGGVA